MGERGSFSAVPFSPASNDELTEAYADVAQFLEEARKSVSEYEWYNPVGLKNHPTGRKMLDAGADAGRKYVLAALACTKHWDAESERVRAQGKSEMERMNAHSLPGWNEVWGNRQRAKEVVTTLMKRALPFTANDLHELVTWCTASDRLSRYYFPLSSIARAIERFAKDHPIPAPLKDEIATLAAVLLQSYEKSQHPLGTRLEQLIRPDDASPVASSAEAAIEQVGPVVPAPAGNPRVMVQSKKILDIAAPDLPQSATERIGPDLFEMRADSPLREEHRLIAELMNEVVGTGRYHEMQLDELKFGQLILAGSDEDRGRMLLAAGERVVFAKHRAVDYSDPSVWQARYAADNLMMNLVRTSLLFSREQCFDYLLLVSTDVPHSAHFVHEPFIKSCLKSIEGFARSAALTEGERYVLFLYRIARIQGPPLGNPGEEIVKLNRLIRDGAAFYLVPGEAWTDALNADIASLPVDRQRAWTDLLSHALTATSPRPSAKWLKSAAKAIDALGIDAVAGSLRRWLPLVNKGRTAPHVRQFVGDTRGGGDVMNDQNATVLRGLLWVAPSLAGHDLSHEVSRVCLSAYRKVPGVGPRAVKVGNAAVYALSEMASPETVGQLAMLKVRVKFGTAQKEIEKAFNVAAEKLGLPRDQIEEMGVPPYGLEDVGHRRETFASGEFICDLRVDGRDAALHWSRADGKSLKSVPAKVKSDHKEELKELQTAAKDIAAMLPAQSERLDSMFLLQKQWKLPVWRERYLDHPLVGTLARRLIWCFVAREKALCAIWNGETLVDVNDKPLEISDDAVVSLWHPIGRRTEEILAWRVWLTRHEVQQPFKQAHREIYVLTDAERTTETYSNRFAAHIVRQHQFNALCAAHGWKNKLRLLVDDVYPPASRELPQWGLRAEFWIEGIGENHGTDTTDSGAFLRLATDQVRFYRATAARNTAHAGGGGYGTRAVDAGEGNINEPLRLQQIPALPFSEILRDVDLFVGVASIGNDQAWQDGGPEGRYRAYWDSYSFGDLTETAKTRRQVLETLLPRLTKLNDRWRLDDKFLIVCGDLRSYRIHLGSGNILMEPSNEYLCIVPGRSSDATAGVFLPFEGDQTLSIILSKAFLLAADTKINDATITRQIKKSEN